MKIFTLTILFFFINDIVESCKTHETIDILIPSENKTNLNVHLQSDREKIKEMITAETYTADIFIILTFVLVAMIYIIASTYIIFYNYAQYINVNLND